eukprot:TRINITY_DN56009_c0_g1_i1.p1 TRINITY_DN56009_c0_g1~~TRINITY_DN56009_c0_g1_i1.p1  ORF type:complete len:263 (+),score=56.55 TRINITY_DN56009_c0_g1_i1:75-791(+)
MADPLAGAAVALDPCYFHMHGGCSRGDSCKFPHIGPTSARLTGGKRTAEQLLQDGESDQGQLSDEPPPDHHPLYTVEDVPDAVGVAGAGDAGDEQQPWPGMGEFAVCRYWAVGHCDYGDRCKFVHPLSAPQVPAVEEGQWLCPNCGSVNDPPSTTCHRCWAPALSRDKQACALLSRPDVQRSFAEWLSERLPDLLQRERRHIKNSIRRLHAAGLVPAGVPDEAARLGAVPTPEELGAA